MSRRFYSDCRVEVTAWGDQDAFDCDDAEVWIEGESILVSYFDDDGIVVLEGRSDRAGGWMLGARSRPRRATLHPLHGGSDLGVDTSGDERGVASGVLSERVGDDLIVDANGDPDVDATPRSFAGTIDEQGETGRWTLRLGALATED